MQLQNMKLLSGLILDFNNTLVKGNDSEYAGKKLMIDLLRGGHVQTFAKAYSAFREIRKIVNDGNGSADALIHGQRIYYKTLIDHKFGHQAKIEKYVGEYVNAHVIGVVYDIVNSYVNAGMPVILATASGNTSAIVAMEKLGITTAVSNTEVFTEGLLTGFVQTITSGASKYDAVAEVLYEYNLKLGNCAMIGDDLLDFTLLKNAGKPFASPYAIPEVTRIPGIIMLG